eukprot:CAMPEP_0185202170 /NCGR_PEP_ID=MMETSP1140-20130426/50593_1 /TAXON_ID=298111 /ORGANISM="Pavlova sp., Strain CCMP459" /LENGTH=78 /DNA_ID=CAMNT_0027769593 /DNA_START=22 /DNA_END=258 /DNA_ORIENTATION=+
MTIAQCPYCGYIIGLSGGLIGIGSRSGNPGESTRRLQDLYQGSEQLWTKARDRQPSFGCACTPVGLQRYHFARREGED